VNQDHLGKALQFSMAVDLQTARKELGQPKSIWKDVCDMLLIVFSSPTSRSTSSSSSSSLNQLQSFVVSRSTWSTVLVKFRKIACPARKHGSYSAGGSVRARVTFYIKLWNGV